MAGPKAKIPAPIDRPLSRAYLREFSGWSTAYPPGQSEPTSLRIMENTMINRDGSLRIRPGLRYLSYGELPEGAEPGVAFDQQLIGTHEAFYLNDGTKAYLFAVKEDDGTVGFRVLSFASAGTTVLTLTDAGFSIPQTEAAINFTADTTYVKYLQVDNKIFALSDAGETMRLFYVGANKVARKIISIERPNWSVADKLTVVHPDAAWITGSGSDPLRENLLHNPAMHGLTGWTAKPGTQMANQGSVVKSGDSAMVVKTGATKRNMLPDPLGDVSTHGIDNWSEGTDGLVLHENGDYLELDEDTGAADRTRHAFYTGGGANEEGLLQGVVAGEQYQVSGYWGSMHDSVDANILIRFYNSAGTQVGADMYQNRDLESQRIIWDPVTAPPTATQMRVRVGMKIKTTSEHDAFVKQILVTKYGEDHSTYWDGDSGAGYSWEGTPHNSPSVYWPSADVEIESGKHPVEPLGSMIAAAELRRAATAGNGEVGIRWYNAVDAVISTVWSGTSALASGSWTRKSKIAAAPAGATHAATVVRIPGAAAGAEFYVDEAMLEPGTVLGAYFDGDTAPTVDFVYGWTGTPHESGSQQWEYDSLLAGPTAETPTDKTLVPDLMDLDEFGLDVFYNFAFFYTFSNEVGESAASQVTNIKTRRGWSAWRWETPNVAGEPSGNPVSDPARACDQLVATMPEDVFDTAVAQGAHTWSLYMLTWSSQSVVPVTGVKVAERDLTNNPTYEAHGWAQVTPQALNLNEDQIVPYIGNRRNYSEPSRGGQGLIAADRMIMVKDPAAQAVIRWTSNEQGDYTNFTASRGGGYKTLTSGNLYIPAAVKLWQNPQSADTITILCQGTDGHSTAYYMAPAEVTSQSDATPIMGFEETTATPGTTSPYGCEVFNNSLYHPVDEQLMKSTASNYNINHKSMSDMIEDRWVRLQQKHKIVSSLHDSRLYYIVNNPDGESLEPGMNGNEIWVFDGAAENGHWSRWLIQAHSLRKIEQGGRIYMSVVRPEGIYYLDPLYDRDDVAVLGGEVSERFIPWRIETNTQGANRAHDAWSHLRQMDLNVGNFQGRMKWGLRSKDLNGKVVDISKITSDFEPADLVEGLPFDLHDQLLINRNLQEWFFYASSVEDAEGNPEWSRGQINNVQYRYAPISVNVGYEHGSVETFEYGRDVALAESNTNDGVPVPVNDRGRP